jgi:hypothetical protein
MRVPGSHIDQLVLLLTIACSGAHAATLRMQQQAPGLTMAALASLMASAVVLRASWHV